MGAGCSRLEGEHKSNTTQVLRLMYAGEGDLAKRIREAYMKDPEAQKFLSELRCDKKPKGIRLHRGHDQVQAKWGV
jgi:hypothetical protein